MSKKHHKGQPRHRGKIPPIFKPTCDPQADYALKVVNTSMIITDFAFNQTNSNMIAVQSLLLSAELVLLSGIEAGVLNTDMINQIRQDARTNAYSLAKDSEKLDFKGFAQF